MWSLPSKEWRSGSGLGGRSWSQRTEMCLESLPDFLLSFCLTPREQPCDWLLYFTSLHRKKSPERTPFKFGNCGCQCSIEDKSITLHKKTVVLCCCWFYQWPLQISNFNSRITYVQTITLVQHKIFKFTSKNNSFCTFCYCKRNVVLGCLPNGL